MPGSLEASFAALPEIPDEEAWARKLAFHARFDALLSDACFREDISLKACREGSSQSEPIPCAYFFKPRGFSYSWGSRIDDIPANSSAETIFDSRGDGKWENAIVDREQFLSWFTHSKSEILGDPIVRPASSLEGRPALSAIQPSPQPKASRASRLSAARKWYAERVKQWNGSPRGPKADDDHKLMKELFQLGRADARLVRNECAPEAWKQSGSKDAR